MQKLAKTSAGANPPESLKVLANHGSESGQTVCVVVMVWLLVSLLLLLFVDFISGFFCSVQNFPNLLLYRCFPEQCLCIFCSSDATCFAQHGGFIFCRSVTVILLFVHCTSRRFVDHCICKLHCRVCVALLGCVLALPTGHAVHCAGALHSCTAQGHCAGALCALSAESRGPGRGVRFQP